MVQVSKGLSVKFRFIAGMTAAVLVGLSVVFKLFHLMGANILLILGVFTFAFGYLPFLFFSLYKKSVSWQKWELHLKELTSSKYRRILSMLRIRYDGERSTNHFTKAGMISIMQSGFDPSSTAWVFSYGKLNRPKNKFWFLEFFMNPKLFWKSCFKPIWHATLFFLN